MNFTISVKVKEAKEPVLLINEELARDLNLSRKKRGYVSFGIQKSYVDIVTTNDIDEKEIYLSKAIIEDLHIPSYPTYEIRTNGNEIIIGPCVGILVSQKYEDISKRMLKEISLNIIDYPRINGAILAFSLDKVNKEKRLIEGYCYNPQTNSWDVGVFPYPLAIYKKSRLNVFWQNHFLSAIGDRVFNNYSFDKWDMYQWFSSEREVASYLPRTLVYQSPRDILGMLKKFGVIYVKPISGMKGHGVIKVSNEKEKVTFEYREEDENIKLQLDDQNEVKETIERLFSPEEHIIQQGLELFKYDGGIVDFRCAMQKDETSKWVCNGIIARIGAKDSVVSNISSGGAALPALELIRESLAETEVEAFMLKERIISACTKMCTILDEYGFNFGTLGLDIGIDMDKNIWLIEINNRRPHPAVALRANDIVAYYNILAGPLSYAKSLAGFGFREEE